MAIIAQEMHGCNSFDMGRYAFAIILVLITLVEIKWVMRFVRIRVWSMAGGVLAVCCAAFGQAAPTTNVSSPAPVSAVAAQGAESAAAAAPTPAPDPTRPLPDIPKLMEEVHAHQAASEAIEKDYIYRSVLTVKVLNKKGDVKDDEENAYDDFWINGVEVQRQVEKKGKPLTDDEKRKEDERVTKEIEKAKQRRAKADAKGEETDSEGHEVITLSRILELGSFSNARREMLHGRQTVAVDYTGDPKAKTKTPFEGVVRNVAATLWVDEDDKDIAQVEGHFVDNFKLAGGLLVNIQKGFEFSMEQTRVNGEVWLPAHFGVKGMARFFLLFNGDVAVSGTSSDYRKFKTDSTIVGVGKGDKPVDGPAAPPN